MFGATATLLWAACRPAPDPDEVLAAARAGADLSSAARVAVTQRVSPLLWRALVACGFVSGDEDWASGLRRDAARCRAQALLLLPRLGPTALVPLAKAGLPPLVFKGAALAARYPEPGLRPMDDVDLVLPPEQIGPGVAALESAGWRVVPDRWNTHHEVILVHDELPGLPLELHRALATWRERSNHLTTLDLWRWRAPGTVAGERVFTLPPEEELVALAAHAAKPFHVFDRLIWSVDVAAVIADAGGCSRPIDWERVGALAGRARCRTGLAVALTQADRLGAASPAALRRCPATQARQRALLPVLSPEWPLVERGWSMRTRLRYALVDDWRQRVTLLTAQVIDNGFLAAPRNAIDLGARGVRRWWRLRHEAAHSGPRGHDGRQPVEP